MEPEILINSLWVLMAAIVVFFMQAGFALLEAGLCRSKNTVNILMKNSLDFGIGAISYTLIGFGIMYGASASGLFGTSNFGNPVKNFEIEGLMPGSFFFFQLVFAAATATIVTGAMAERTNFKAYLIYSSVMCLVIYPVSGHWIWGGGWLSEIGFMDYAGSTAVHSVGGWAALVGAAIVGPRIGKYVKDPKTGKTKVNSFPAHNIFLSCLGMFVLWLGWYGFNPGSELAFNENVLHTVITTTAAVACGSVTSMITSWARYGKPDLSLVINGVLGSLVGITAGCRFVDLWGAMIIGALAGIFVIFSIEFIDRILKIDDPVGASTVHGTCGVFGTLMIGLFSSGGENGVHDGASGLFYGGGLKLLGIQILGAFAVFVWVVAMAFILFTLLKKFAHLRVSPAEELKGLDIEEHGAVSYPEFVLHD
ncbi:MAG: ammonium transporter [Oscillospiraceae bacterium]|jgi:Amt family ammonium transporter|nr:ammonium transporter [Oscillospiraceae bacterium]